jgi:hypothetical protein
MTTDAEQLDTETVAIRAELASLNAGSPAHEAAQARLEAMYQAKYPPSPQPPDRAEEVAAPPAARPSTGPRTAADIRAEMDRVNEGGARHAELTAELERFYKSKYGGADDNSATHASTPAPAAPDPEITTLNDELRGLKPGTPEWTATVDEIDARVLAQPARAEDRGEIRRAASGLGIEVAPDEEEALAQVYNVVRANIRPDATPIIVSGMMAVRRAQLDAAAGQPVNETWDALFEELEAEWGSDTERRLEDIREAVAKMPRRLRDGLLKSKEARFNKGLYMFLADVGSKIPLGPQ